MSDAKRLSPLNFGLSQSRNRPKSTIPWLCSPFMFPAVLLDFPKGGPKPVRSL